MARIRDPPASHRGEAGAEFARDKIFGKSKTSNRTDLNREFPRWILSCRFRASPFSR
ncbi:hypothetical protein KL86PLE_130036 [uncultured Pleomorphomonas sp.]|uniref:Uncharacterized protein n=1 Tax=uncultured Pleomorphomonas sp. TaxID=442121 RepID=A0A212L8R8_9HYPH|nr:hypothetical protein KL86PLE_130036 [uncultured Pleomorphomonas sp.]